MQSHVTTDGVVVWTGCSVGSTLRKAMCDNNKALSAVNGGRLEDPYKDQTNPKGVYGSFDQIGSPVVEGI